MKEKVYKIYIPIYGCAIELVVTDDIVASQEDPDRWEKYGRQDTHEFCDGLSFRYSSLFCIMFLEPCISHSTIAHELLHTTNGILSRCGHEPQSDDEPHAYLIGYIADQVYCKLREWKVKIK